MSDGFPERIKVQTTTLKSGIAYGIASLGAVPLRYGQPRFPSLRRKYQNYVPTKQLLKGEDPNNQSPPDIFALSSFSMLSKPAQKAMGNQSALRQGVNFSSSNGQLVKVSGAYIEIACNANIYATSMDSLHDWVDSVIAQSTIRGASEFADGSYIPIHVEITPNFAWTDPVEPTDGINWIDRLFSISVDFTVLTVSAHLSTYPLFKGYVINKRVGESVEVVEELSAAVNPEDWT